MLSVAAERIERRTFWRTYLAERNGTYRYRCRRYHAVALALAGLNLTDGDLIFDVGAGACEFDRFLRAPWHPDRLEGWGWEGQYVPVDGAIDGTDLNEWKPYVQADFYVAIELVEHLRDPWTMLRYFKALAGKGAVITTPNPETVDVLALDKTHKTALYPSQLRQNGWTVTRACLFDQHPEDTLIAVYSAPSKAVEVDLDDERTVLHNCSCSPNVTAVACPWHGGTI